MRSLCFIADTTFEKKDFGPVPFDNIYFFSGIHTWVISAILDASFGENTFFRVMPFSYRLILVIFFVFLFILLGLINKDSVFNLISAFLFISFTGLSLYLWFFHLYIPWFTACAFIIIFSWLLNFTYRFLSQHKRQTALERYVPRAVASKLVAGQRTNLIPVYKELTILFSDIKSFTTWSAEKEPKDVHDFLNDYLESMADILFMHNATVDKFMGDGILAFFGDPLDIPNHAAEAIKSAIAMQKKAEILKAKWQSRVGIDLQVRIGINTGKVIVGDLGTKRRIEYTVIGSAVNLAQRMEGLATPGGILVTENTKNAAEMFMDKTFSFNEKLELTVRGYDHKVTAFTVS
jgi:adenylate cyclase